MSVAEAGRASLQRQLEPLVTREISGIAALDTAMAHESAPDYVVMFQAAKNGKQANVEQMATLVRMLGGTPDERGGIRKALAKTQAGITSRFSRTRTLQAMRAAETELITRYCEAVACVDGLARRALRKALGRSLIHAHLLTAHLAKRTSSGGGRPAATGPPRRVFRRQRAARLHALSPRSAGHVRCVGAHRSPPYTYVCAACHDEVLAEFPPDLAMQMDRWPREVREAKVLQHGLGRVSRLNALGRVLHPLAGLEPELPTPAAERAVIIPAMTPSPGPAPSERQGVLTIEKSEGPEGDSIDRLFSARHVWNHW